MHDSVREFIHEIVVVDYTYIRDGQTIEFGSLDVNGSVREFFTGGYIGIDMQAGPGVDYVCSTWNTPFADSSFDTVVSTEMLEHDAHPELTFKEANRLLKPGGNLLLTCRGPGFPLHEYPSDYWRFTPDDLTRLACFAGFEVISATADHHVPGSFLHAIKVKGPSLDNLLALEFTPVT